MNPAPGLSLKTEKKPEHSILESVCVVLGSELGGWGHGTKYFCKED